MAGFEFHDYSVEVKDVMNSKIRAVLEEVSGELESAAKRKSRVKTGKTQNSFRHEVSRTSGGYTAQIGSDYKNAIWEEFGTGEYALGGNGRKGGWWYPADKVGFIGKLRGKKPSKFIFTRGKKPTRAFWNAYTGLKSAIISQIQNALRGM